MNEILYNEEYSTNHHGPSSVSYTNLDMQLMRSQNGKQVLTQYMFLKCC